MMRLIAIEPPSPFDEVSPRSSEREQARILVFEPTSSVPAGDYRLAITYPKHGLVDVIVEVRYANGEQSLHRLRTALRNHYEDGVRLDHPLLQLRLHVAGTVAVDVTPRVLLTRWPSDETYIRRQARRLREAFRSDPASVLTLLSGAMTRTLKRLAKPSGVDPRETWQALFDDGGRQDRKLHKARLRLLSHQPVIGVLSEGVDGAPQALVEALDTQIYPKWRLLDRSERDLSGVDFILVVSPHVRLRPHALLEFAVATSLVPNGLLFYADHAETGGDLAVQYRFKPAWSPERFTTRDYLGPAVLYAAESWRAAVNGSGNGAQGDEQNPHRMATVMHGPGAIVHIPRVLTIVPAPAHRVWCLPEAHHPVKHTPFASIIVPTRDRADLLSACIGSIRRHTRPASYEIIVVDNGSSDPISLALLEAMTMEPDTRVIRRPGPFNYSAMNNDAATIASGDVLLFLNNDVEIPAPGLLARIITQACAPDIGCVGVVLLYPDGRIQHAGIALGFGNPACAVHTLRGRDPNDPALQDDLSVRRNVSAVTGACLAVRKDLFLRLGGFDAVHLPVSYNDVDLCLKASSLDIRNVCLPVRLIHHESLSRGADDTPEKQVQARRELAAMHRRWGLRMLRDPYYSPNLTQESDDMSIRVR